MNRRTLVILLIVLVVLAGIAAWFVFSQHGPNAGTGPTNQNPFGGATSGTNPGFTTSSSTQQAGTMAITDAYGASVSVPAFTTGRTPIQGSDGSNYYDLVHQGPVYGNENETFAVQYGEKNSDFTVLLLTEPLSAARADAENFLRATLKLPDAELCKLKITVGVTASTNSIYSRYDNLGLSFCPGAIRLP